MDNSIRKWLIRAGSLLIVLGFFVPSVAVSCTTVPGAAQSFSMGQLASQANQPLLYLVLLGAVAALIVAFIPARDGLQNTLFLMGEILGLGLGALSIFATVVSLSWQMQQTGFEVSIDIGLFVLLLGYGLGGAGILLEFLQRGRSLFQYSSGVPPGLQPDLPQAAYSPPPPVFGAQLELVRGNAPSVVPINIADFVIGRSSHSHLQLSDSQVSGTHVRLRFAQGSWFIQDQGSSNGTYVNGRRIQAQRLNNGDQIRIGETTYAFRM